MSPTIESVVRSEIPFIQYLRPDGRRRIILMNRTGHVAVRALALYRAGFRFEAEESDTRQVVLRVLWPLQDKRGANGPLASVLCGSVPGITDGVDRLVEEAHERMCQLAGRILNGPTPPTVAVQLDA